MNKETVDIYNPKVIRSTMGAIFRVPFVITDDLPQVVEQLKQKGISVYAGHLKGDVFYKQDYRNGSKCSSVCHDSYVRNNASERIYIRCAVEVWGCRAIVPTLDY